MINVLSYIGMNMQSEVCLWTLVGLIRTIFDATLFKVNANLKQVWQMAMPEEMSLPVQRVLRTMISGVMLVQCFTVYVYLASYIVLLYPVFLEERPTLVLPWLLVAAIRQLLCELTSLALGLGTCVLLGPARPPCIKFVIVKLVSITPAFYMWMLVFSYYHILKVAAAFKTFSVVLQPSDHDYGLELAIRRRRTKSLLGEDQLRCKLVASLYGERSSNNGPRLNQKLITSNMMHSTNTSHEDIQATSDIIRPLSLVSNFMSETGSYEDRYGVDFAIPRDADRILEQFVLMLLRIRSHILANEDDSTPDPETLVNRSAISTLSRRDNINNCTTIPPEDMETPPQVGSQGNTASYVRDYPKIFMRKASENPITSEMQSSSRNIENQIENEINGIVKTRDKKRTVFLSPNEKIVSRRKSADQDNQQSSLKQSSTSSRSTQATLQLKDKSGNNATKLQVLDEKKTEPQNNLQTLQSKDSITSLLSRGTESNALRNNQSSSKKEDQMPETNLQIREIEQSSTNVNKHIDKKNEKPDQ